MVEPIYHPNLSKLLLGIEFISALIAFIYFPKIKHTYWKWFAIYLMFVCFQEYFWKFQTFFSLPIRKGYFTFLGIPIQLLFFYWLYARKSLKNNKLFYVFISIYLLTYIPFGIFFKEIDAIYSINLTIGTILLIVLIVLEFIKQIKNDDILKFKENKMFYINLGIILFYVGCYPFHSFYLELLKAPYTHLWNMYYLYFLIANCIMYLLFTASLIWGKHQS